MVVEAPMGLSKTFYTCNSIFGGLETCPSRDNITEQKLLIF